MRPSAASRSCCCASPSCVSCDATARNDPSRALSTLASWSCTLSSVSRTGWSSASGVLQEVLRGSGAARPATAPRTPRAPAPAIASAAPSVRRRPAARRPVRLRARPARPRAASGGHHDNRDGRTAEQRANQRQRRGNPACRAIVRLCVTGEVTPANNRKQLHSAERTSSGICGRRV